MPGSEEACGGGGAGGPPGDQRTLNPWTPPASLQAAVTCPHPAQDPESTLHPQEEELLLQLPPGQTLPPELPPPQPVAIPTLGKPQPQLSLQHSSQMTTSLARTPAPCVRPGPSRPGSTSAQSPISSPAPGGPGPGGDRGLTSPASFRRSGSGAHDPPHPCPAPRREAARTDSRGRQGSQKPWVIGAPSCLGALALPWKVSAAVTTPSWKAPVWY